MTRRGTYLLRRRFPDGHSRRQFPPDPADAGGETVCRPRPGGTDEGSVNVSARPEGVTQPTGSPPAIQSPGAPDAFPQDDMNEPSSGSGMCVQQSPSKKQVPLLVTPAPCHSDAFFIRAVLL